MDKLVEVKLSKDYLFEKYTGLCGFYISKGEKKKCPEDVFQKGQVDKALVLAKAEPKPEPEEKTEPEEPKSLMDKVRSSGKKGKK